MLRTVTHVESHVKISRCVENVYIRHVENHIENLVEVRKKTPSHFTARVEIEQQISFFSFGFARESEVRHIPLNFKTDIAIAHLEKIHIGGRFKGAQGTRPPPPLLVQFLSFPYSFLPKIMTNIR